MSAARWHSAAYYAAEVSHPLSPTPPSNLLGDPHALHHLHHA